MGAENKCQNIFKILLFIQGAIGTNITIDVVCGIMTNSSYGSELDRYAAVNSLILDIYSQKCLDFKYNKMISDLQQTGWNSTASEQGGMDGC